MGADTKISWADHTFNPWRGCTKISPGCAHCYADAQSARNPSVLGIWGPNGTRVVASEAKWREPLQWNEMVAWARAAVGETRNARVFCASLADVFEDWAGRILDAKGRIAHTWPDGYWTFLTPEEAKTPPFVPGQRSVGLMARPLTLHDVRRRLFSLIDKTPSLDWLLLTKRPENIPSMLPTCKQCETVGRVCPTCTHCHGAGRCLTTRRVWLGVSVEDQATAEQRIPRLLDVPAAVRFLSCEPLIERIDLRQWLTSIDWVIVGGESGPHARPMFPTWARSIRDQCEAAGVPFFFKQMGGRGRDKGGNLLDGEIIQEFPQTK